MTARKRLKPSDLSMDVINAVYGALYHNLVRLEAELKWERPNDERLMRQIAECKLAFLTFEPLATKPCCEWHK